MFDSSSRLSLVLLLYSSFFISSVHLSTQDRLNEYTQQVTYVSWRVVGKGVKAIESTENLKGEFSAADNGFSLWYFQSQTILSEQPVDIYGWNLQFELGHLHYDTMGEPPLHFPDLVIRCKPSESLQGGITLGLWDVLKPWERRHHSVALSTVAGWVYLVEGGGEMAPGAPAEPDILRAALGCKGTIVIRGGFYAGSETTWLKRVRFSPPVERNPRFVPSILPSATIKKDNAELPHSAAGSGGALPSGSEVRPVRGQSDAAEGQKVSTRQDKRPVSAANGELAAASRRRRCFPTTGLQAHATGRGAVLATTADAGAALHGDESSRALVHATANAVRLLPAHLIAAWRVLPAPAQPHRDSLGEGLGGVLELTPRSGRQAPLTVPLAGFPAAAVAAVLADLVQLTGSAGRAAAAISAAARPAATRMPLAADEAAEEGACIYWTSAEMGGGDSGAAAEAEETAAAWTLLRRHLDGQEQGRGWRAAGAAGDGRARRAAVARLKAERAYAHPRQEELGLFESHDAPRP